MNISRWFVVLITLFSSAIAGQGFSLAQKPETTFISELTGLTVDIGHSGEATFNHDYHRVWQDGPKTQEDVYFERGHAKVFVSFVQGGGTPAGWEQISIEAAAPTYLQYRLLGDEITETTSWALYEGIYMLDFTEITYSEFELGVFNDVHLSFVIYTSPNTLVDDLRWIAGNVFVEDTSALMNTDYSHLEPYLSRISPTQPQLLDDHITTVEDWRDQGLESEHSWSSPQFGSSLSWDDTWMFPFARSQSAGSETNPAGDFIRLVTPDFSGDVTLFVQESSADRSTPQDWIDRWTSEEWIAGLQPALTLSVVDTIVTGDTAGVIFEGQARYGERMVVVYSAHIAEDGTTVLTLFRSRPENVALVYEQFVAGVIMDGAAVPVAWPLEEIQALPAQ